MTDCLNVGEEVTAAVETLGIRLNPDRQRWYGEPGPESRRTFFRQTRGMRLDDLRDRTGAEPLSERLWRRYGRRAFEMLDHIREDPSMADHTHLAARILEQTMQRISASASTHAKLRRDWPTDLKRDVIDATHLPVTHADLARGSAMGPGKRPRTGGL